MRIFFGATLPEKTRDEILTIEEMLRPAVRNARFEAGDKLHITLQFIGDFDSGKVGELFDSAAKELGRHSRKSPLTELIGPNYFPNGKVRRGIWLECGDDGSLASYAGALCIATSKYGIVPEGREFRPHITIARLLQINDRGFRNREKSVGGHRSESPFPEDLQKFIADGKLSVERFFPQSVALFESTLRPSGSEYRILYEYTLERSGD